MMFAGLTVFGWYWVIRLIRKWRSAPAGLFAALFYSVLGFIAGWILYMLMNLIYFEGIPLLIQRPWVEPTFKAVLVNGNIAAIFSGVVTFSGLREEATESPDETAAT